MRIPSPRLAAALIPLAALVTLSNAPARAEVIDGGFEQGPRGWKTILTAPSDGEVPVCAGNLNLPLPPGASEGRRHLVILGDVSRRPAPGCDPSLIYQDFVCDSDPSADGFCTVSFDVSFWQASREKAAVLIKTSQSVKAWEIPAAAGTPGGRYAVSTPGCTQIGPKNRIVFVVWSPADSSRGTRSVMWVDNVESYCSAQDKSSPDLAPIAPGQLPVDAELLAGFILRPGMSAADCNNNGIPDTYELNQTPELDQDNDGIIDQCVTTGGGVTWIISCVVVMILGVTILRLVRKNRARFEK